jgi:hypothetical protein
MSPQNGRIADDIKINLPRPRGRNRNSDAYKAYTDQLKQLVHSSRNLQEEFSEEI